MNCHLLSPIGDNSTSHWTQSCPAHEWPLLLQCISHKTEQHSRCHVQRQRGKSSESRAEISLSALNRVLLFFGTVMACFTNKIDKHINKPIKEFIDQTNHRIGRFSVGSFPRQHAEGGRRAYHLDPGPGHNGRPAAQQPGAGPRSIHPPAR